MRDVAEHRRESLDQYVDALPYPEDTCGVIVAIDGKFVAADIFDRSDTLERIWPRLVTGYAMDASGSPVSGSAKPAERSIPGARSGTGSSVCRSLATCS